MIWIVMGLIVSCGILCSMIDESVDPHADSLISHVGLT